jgi:precorrin-6Y C5,15-methyltransferase (decarboxylating)
MPNQSFAQRWLTVIGIGEDGPAGLGEDAKLLIQSAPLVFGGARHIELTASLIRGETHVWLSPIERSIDRIVAERGNPVVVLASGDPFFFGVGVTLARRVPASEMTVIPAPSSFSLAASRLGWALQDTAIVSLHGRPIDLIRPDLHPGRKILALTSDEQGPAALATLLCQNGFGGSKISVLEALGGRQERISTHSADAFPDIAIHALNICGIDVVARQAARILPLGAGLDDALFEHDGQITKREVRAVTLSSLAPRRGELMWDVGAGSGSIGIEWMLSDPSMRAIAIEASNERAARIARNTLAFGTPGLVIVEGNAPGALAGLPEPDAIFIGGGGSDAGVIEACVSALKQGGRLVANAVTVEMELVLLTEQARRGGSLIRLNIARAAPVGTMTGWRAAMPVTQWLWVKP